MGLISHSPIASQSSPTNPTTSLPVSLFSFTRFSSFSPSNTHSSSSSSSSSSAPIRFHPSFLPLPPNPSVLCLRRCRAASPGPPPPPQTDPPLKKDRRQLTGLAASFSKIQDRVQIFFAVLFWMSLFFWASAWDGRNRPNKGSRFKR